MRVAVFPIDLFSYELMRGMGKGHRHDDDHSITSCSADEKLFRLTVEEKMRLPYFFPSRSAHAKDEATLGLACPPKK